MWRAELSNELDRELLLRPPAAIDRGLAGACTGGHVLESQTGKANLDEKVPERLENGSL
jgi:hypothetical protein